VHLWRRSAAHHLWQSLAMCSGCFRSKRPLTVTDSGYYLPAKYRRFMPTVKRRSMLFTKKPAPRKKPSGASNSPYSRRRRIFRPGKAVEELRGGVAALPRTSGSEDLRSQGGKADVSPSHVAAVFSSDLVQRMTDLSQRCHLDRIHQIGKDIAACDGRLLQALQGSSGLSAVQFLEGAQIQYLLFLLFSGSAR